ncbi:MAG: CRISPR-associated endoribonuclease Cas6 [Bacteroidota bacterium]
MRLEFLLSPKELRFSIPINYNYLLFSSIASILYYSPVKFHSWISDNQKSIRILPNNKLFTFSKMLCPNSKVTQSSYSGFGDVKLLFSAPIEDDLAPIIISTLKSREVLKIENYNGYSEFYFKSIKQLPEPEFEYERKFVMLSPTVISKVMFSNGNKILHFYRINESETAGAIAYNLRRKYEIIHKAQFKGRIDVEFDSEYVEIKGGSEGVSKLVTIREGSLEEYKLKGFIAPVTIRSEPEILRIAYQCGIGEFNCLGLGMLETVLEKPKKKFDIYENHPVRRKEKMECIPV